GSCKEIPLKDSSQIACETEATTASWPKQKLYMFYYYTAFFLFACTAFGIVTSGTLTLYIDSYIDRNVMGFEVPPTWFNSLDSIGFLIWVPIITLFYKKRSLKKKDESVSIPSRFSIGLFIHFIAFSLLTITAYQNEFFHNNQINPIFIIAYFIISNAGWVMLDSGVLIASSELVPQKKLGFYMGIHNLSMGLGFYLGSWLGILSVRYNAFYVFSSISLFLLFSSILTFALKNSLERRQQHNSSGIVGGKHIISEI
ncbi:MAG: hypothetical protein K2X39_03455, partial [Silvanigrellaceae bacterium]|nr:hypothetical protein [Silvanigrellaceae bacterium]